jgi:hypothetical protein
MLKGTYMIIWGDQISENEREISNGDTFKHILAYYVLDISITYN